jgi:hypothetical protein
VKLLKIADNYKVNVEREHSKWAKSLVNHALQFFDQKALKCVSEWRC